MRLMQSMLRSADVSRFGWTLVHSLWQGAAVAALLAIALYLLRRSSSQSRYIAGCVAMALMILLPTATFIVLNPAAKSEQPSTTAPTSKVELTATKLLRRSSAHSAQPIAELPDEGLVAPIATIADAPKPGASRSESVLPWLVAIWTLGVASLSLWNLGGWITLQRLKFVGTKSAPADIQARLLQLSMRLRLSRAVRILESTRVRSPLTIGAFKPIILIPASVISELPLAQLESIIAHELAHIRRHDYLINLLQSVIETLLFYHPATWWIGRRIRAERENCCDDIALNLCQDRATYAAALANIAAAKVPPLALAARGGMLLARVRRILGMPELESRRTGGWAVGIVGLATCLVFASMLATPVHTKAQQSSAAPVTQPAQTMDLLVVDPETRVPLPDARISWRHGNKTDEAHTDTGGHAVIAYDTKGYLSLAIHPKDDAHIAYGVRFGRMNAPKAVPSHYTLAVPRGTHIGGRVVDEQNKPIGGATVYLQILGENWQTADNFAMSVLDQPVKTEADGRWNFNGAGPGEITTTLRATHPDFASDETAYTQKPKLADLRSDKAVTVMKIGVSLTGMVEDAAGKPIGNAHLGIGGNGYDVHPMETTAKPDGTFELPHCVANATSVLVVTAPGFAPSDVRLDLSSAKSNVHVKMQPAKQFRFLVVDSAGKPIPDVDVRLQGWHGLDSLMRWQARTDSTGHAVWDSAPADTVLINFMKLDYLPTEYRHAAVDGEQRIVLYPPFHVAATVVDGETNKALSEFSVVHGFFTEGHPGIVWERGDRVAGRTFDNGKFDFVEGSGRDGYGFRVEAPGFMPFESPIYKRSGGNVSFDIRLKKAANIASTLVDSNGKPLANATVLISMAGTQIMIEDGKLTRQTMAQQTTTDDSGHFTLTPQPGDYSIVVVHENGHAIFKPDQMKDRFVVPAWGRVAGITRVGTKPAAGVTMTGGNMIEPFLNTAHLSISDHAKVDDAGHYLLTHLSAGSAQVGIEQITEMNGRSWMVMTTHAQRLEIVPGQTIEANFGGTGRPVIGHLAAPPALAGKFEWPAAHGFIQTKIDRPKRDVPADFATMDPVARAKINHDWQQSPAGKAYTALSAKTVKLTVRVEKDGSFRIEDVPAGIYTMSFSIMDHPTAQFANSVKTLASGSQLVTVAPMPGGRSDEPLDIGAIGMTERKSVSVGETAPAFDIKTLDGKPLKLSDFAGKYVLVDFWATWCIPCVNAMPEFKSAYEAFKDNPNFRMVSLSLDEKPAAPLAFVAKEKLAWTQGFLGEWSTTPVPNQWGVQGIPAAFLVGPDGRIVATDLTASNLKEELQRVLGGNKQ